MDFSVNNITFIFVAERIFQHKQNRWDKLVLVLKVAELDICNLGLVKKNPRELA